MKNFVVRIQLKRIVLSLENLTCLQSILCPVIKNTFQSVFKKLHLQPHVSSISLYHIVIDCHAAPFAFTDVTGILFGIFDEVTFNKNSLDGNRNHHVLFHGAFPAAIHSNRSVILDIYPTQLICCWSKPKQMIRLKAPVTCPKLSMRIQKWDSSEGLLLYWPLIVEEVVA